MSLIENNSTKMILPTGSVFQGKAVKPDVKYITIQITGSFNGGNSGLLEIYYSLDGIYYDTFGDSWTYTTLTDEAHIFKETQMKGSYFYVKWTNNGTSDYTSFNLLTKLTTTTSTVSVDGVVNIPTVTVDIEGQTVFSKIRDTDGNALSSIDGKLKVDISGQRVDISGQTVITDISGQRIDISGQIVDISGQKVDISGQWVHSKIYGSSDGVDYHHIKTNNNGVVSTNAVIQDTNGDDFTSHLENGFRGLDTYVLNKVDISGNVYNQDKLKVDVSGQYMNVSNNVQVINGDTNFQTNTYLVNDNGNVADVVKNDVYTLGMLCVLPCSNAGLPYSEFNPMYTMMKAKEPGGANVNLTLTEIDTNIKALDVNVANTSPLNVAMNTNSSFKVDISGVGLSGDKLKVDVSGQRIDISGQTVILGGFDGGVNSNITNSVLKVDVSGVGVSGDKLKVDISGQNTLMTAFYRTGTTNSNLTSIQPYGTANVKALETYSYMVGLNNEISVPLQITSTTGVSTQSLDVHIQNGSTTNLQGQNGINTYPVFPKMKQYTIGGIESNSNAYKMIGGNPTASGLDISGFAYGLANTRPYYASTTTGTPTTDLYIDYVNSSGDLVENAGPYSVVAGSWTTLPTMVGINKFRLTSTLGNTLSSQSLYISPTTNTNRSLYHLSIANYGVGVFTIPNGYIGYISSLTGAFETSASLLILKWDENGIRSVVYKVNVSATTLVLTSGPESSIGGIFYPGESIGFSNNVAVLSKLVQANITLRAIN